MKQPHKPVTYVSNFSKAAWIIRLITMSVALISLLYYLNQYNKGELPFQKEKATGYQKGSVIKMKIPVGRSGND